VFVADVVSAMLAAVGRPAGVYNVGTGVSTSVLDLLSKCCQVAGVLVRPEHAPPRPGDLRDSVLDPGKAERELGWRREHDLVDGLRATWAWASSS
jgi:UDP-glucose 4-epimerase